jgi:hypothetical protein
MAGSMKEDIGPYASGGDTRPAGGGSFTGGEMRDMAGGYGTQDGSNEDHSMPGQRGMRGSANDHTRATNAGKPSRDRGPSKSPKDVWYGVDGARQDSGTPVTRPAQS